MGAAPFAMAQVGSQRSANVKMRITNMKTIMMGQYFYVSLETDVGIIGYGDATNHLLPYGVEGMLKDLIPYVAREDPRMQPHLKGNDGSVEDFKIKRELLENRYS